MDSDRVRRPADFSVGGIATNYAIRWFRAPIEGAVEQREITNRGQYRIQSYEQFYQWHADIGAIEVKLAAYPANLDMRQRTECVGLVAQRANIVASYNAAAAAEKTKGQWLADDLPEYLTHTAPRTC